MSGLMIVSTALITLALVFYSLGVWAERVARRGSGEAREGFHRYSLAVWLVWLIPYLGGMYLAMA